MMIELEQNNYYKAAPLLNGVSFNSFVARILVKNKVKGKIFVDNEQIPSVCLIVHNISMEYLFYMVVIKIIPLITDLKDF